MNHLAQETSPYLLQHAHNPVNWYPWGEEALSIAQREDKPILVSIGYSACHWCHVMERESFEDRDIASLMNEYFVNIKVDREERPDLDHIYMDAVQAISGSGGWPLNVFLTPDARPFYGGTYFPPVAAYNRPSWAQVLISIHKSWISKRQEIEEQAQQLLQHLKGTGRVFNQSASIVSDDDKESFFVKDKVVGMANNLLQTADTIDGGFGRAPKFPQTFSIRFLMEHFYYAGHTASLEHAELSLQKMIHGGIHDQLGGGFSRYSTDAKWIVPHFEKILTDNALLIIAFSEAYQLTKKEIYSRAIKKTIAFLEAEMLDAEGGFYAALDADSEGEEGKFYTWQKQEIDDIVKEDAPFFNEYFNVNQNGNWEHTNILFVTNTLADVATSYGIKEEDAEAMISHSSKALLNERAKRLRPGTDDKIIFGWNALLITAFCKAYAALQISSYLQSALSLYHFVEKAFGNAEKGYFHTYKKGHAKIPAFLDDYAFYIEALIQLQEITGDEAYLLKAKAIAEQVIADFSDEEGIYFYYTSQFQKDIVARKKDIYDGAIPSGNSIMAQNLHYLAMVFEQASWVERVDKMLQSNFSLFEKYPGSFGIWASLYQKLSNPFAQVAIMGQEPDAMLRAFLEAYLPGRVLQSANKVSDMPLLRHRQIQAETHIFVCKDFVCKIPVKDIASAVELINK